MLNDIIDQQTAEFERQMEKVINRLNRKINKIIEGLDIVDGKYVVSGANLDEALVLSKQIEEALRESGYSELAEKTLRQNRELMDIRKDELKTLLGRDRLGSIDTSTFKAIQNVRFEGMSDLGDIQFSRIKDALFNSVNLGLPLTTLRDEIMKDTGILKRHATTYIRTAKREFSQQYENLVAEKINFGESKNDIWEYSPGVLQKNSHEECVYAVNKQYFTNEEKISFESGGLYAHSEPRWNCVHRFTLTNLTYEEAFSGGNTEVGTDVNTDVPIFKTTKEAEEWGINNGLAEKISFNKLRDDEVDIAQNIINTIYDANISHGVKYNKIGISTAKSKIGEVYKNTSIYGPHGELIKQDFAVNIATKRYVEEKMGIKFNDWIIQQKSKGYWVGESQVDLINHEIGHFITAIPTIKEYNSIKLSMRFANINISAYGRSNGIEALAEIWSLYKKSGISALKKEWIEFFNKYSSVAIK